jgi:hypothetical protein
MTTKIIGIKSFRENIAKTWKEAIKENIRYIVMNHSTPILEVTPINEEDFILENLAKDIEIAREQAKKGHVYSQEEVYKKLGL